MIVFGAILVAIAGIGLLDVVGPVAAEAAAHVRCGGGRVALPLPPGGIVLASPLNRPIAGATVNGVPVAAVDAGQVRVDRCPADVELRYTPTS